MNDSLKEHINFGWEHFYKETMLSKRNTELNNGYAAMLGILGPMIYEGIAPLPKIFTTKGD